MASFLITTTVKELTLLPSSHRHHHPSLTSSPYTSLSPFSSAKNNTLMANARRVILHRSK